MKMREIPIISIAAVAGTLLTLSLVTGQTVQSWPQVTISSGNIIGRNFTSEWTNKEMYAFQGIPYAAPPVGTYRFQPPKPPANWTYLPFLNCTEEGPLCFQPDGYAKASSVYVMSENCLNLNVFTGSLTASQPVLVWIHGGGFVSGEGGYRAGAPDMLVAEGVVVVTLNYRLGALGFLTLGTSDAPGNVGFHDQILALKWVQTNIKQFGGDPTKVTIWGESAGSTSVHLLYLSPLAKGLFHSVIAESGTALSNAAWTNGSDYGFQLAKALDCDTSGAATALQCLQLVSAFDIVNAQSNLSISYENTVTGDWLVWRGTVDEGLTSKPFLPDLPENLFLQGAGSQVPILLGNVVDEGVAKLLGTPDAEITNITDNLKYFIPEKIRSGLSETKLSNLTQSIRNQYFPNNGTASPTNVLGYVALLGDYMFKYGTSVSARMYRQRQSSVYLYLFNYDGTYKGLGGTALDKKYNTSFIGHGMDLQYLFVPNGLTAPLPAGNPDLLTWQRMARMWANFAKNGSPTSALEKDTLLQNVSWTPVGSGDKTYYLNIGTNLTMVADPYLKDIVGLWDPILGGVPLISGSGRLEVTAALLTSFVTLLLNYF